MNPVSRTLRIFLSSTFRDFGEERDLLVKRVFPALRARLKDRFVELVDVDLRWGITAEEAERGEVLPICLAEIDRSRPYFIGMLGERYGWVPPPDGYAPDLLERQPWLKKYQGSKSVTELEILHGVLKNKRMKSRAFFYFRSPAYARSKGGHYVPDTTEDRQRQLDLKRRIKDSGYSVTGYRDPEALAKRIERDLWKLIDAEFPVADVPDMFERESIRHEAYAAPRRRLYLGGGRYQALLASVLDSDEQRIVIEGASGGGKSALLANFFEDYRKRHRKHLVHEHYLGASADAASPHVLVRRLLEFIQRTTGSIEAIPGDPQKLMDSMPLWMATASAWARKRRTRFIIVLDSLNSLTDQQDLRWWPAFLPQGVTMVVSCLPGSLLNALKGKTDVLTGQDALPKWKVITVRPLTKAQSADLLNTYLNRFNKKLSTPMVKQVQAHPLATNPLFVRTLAEELRLYGMHEELQKRLDHYLTSRSIDDLFERVLERVENDCGKKQVKSAMTTIWASRAGLTEKEILAIADLKPAEWAPIRNALNEALLESYGKIIFAHSYVQLAVQRRFLNSIEQQHTKHRALGRWFSKQPVGVRRAAEEPFQWLRAHAWGSLRRALTDAALFTEIMTSRGELELLGYWTALQAARSGKPGKAYLRAWKHWRQKESKRGLFALARLLFLFLYRSGDYSAFSIALGQDSIVLARRLLGARSREVAYRMGDLGLMLQAADRLEESMSLTIEAESILETSGSASPADVAAQTSNVARIMQASGHIKESVEKFRKSLSLMTSATAGVNDESVAIVHNNLAMALHDDSALSEARDHYRIAMEKIRRINGDNCPLLGIFGKNLGCLAQDEGDHPLALDLFRQAYKIFSENLGPTHIETVFAESRIGISLYKIRDYESALKHFNHAFEIASMTFEVDHPEYISAENNLKATRNKLYST
jgi:tetratricopeptide (TPR) repeat protein